MGSQGHSLSPELHEYVINGVCGNKRALALSPKKWILPVSSKISWQGGKWIQGTTSPISQTYLEIVDKCFRILHSMIPFESKHPPVKESEASVTAAEEEKPVLKAWVCPLQMSVSIWPSSKDILHSFEELLPKYICHFRSILALLLCWGARLAISFSATRGQGLSARGVSRLERAAPAADFQDTPTWLDDLPLTPWTSGSSAFAERPAFHLFLFLYF